MFPDVINAKHDDGGGGIVHEGHAGVNMDDVRSSGQWVEVPAVANELCDLQILYEEQEDYFCAEAMGWATRKVIIHHWRSGGDAAAEDKVEIRSVWIQNLLMFSINAWNRRSNIYPTEYQYVSRGEHDRLLTAKDRSECWSILQRRSQNILNSDLDDLFSHTVNCIREIVPAQMHVG